MSETPLGHLASCAGVQAGWDTTRKQWKAPCSCGAYSASELSPSGSPAGITREEQRHQIALLLNRLILAASAKGYQQDRDTSLPPEDRITDADIETLEQQIVSLLAAGPSSADGKGGDVRESASMHVLPTDERGSELPLTRADAGVKHPAHESTSAGVIEILRCAYAMVPEDRKGKTRCVDFDPAGSTYEFTEHEWSIKARKILGIRYGPTGI